MLSNLLSTNICKISVLKQVIVAHHNKIVDGSFWNLYNEIVENKSLLLGIREVAGVRAMEEK